MSQERTAVDAAAIGVMVLLTALWGFQQAFFLSEPISGAFVVAALAVAAGIVLVNLRR